MPGHLSDTGSDLAERVLNDFREHPEHHKQDIWWCSTGYCFAGGLILASGAKPIMIYVGHTGDHQHGDQFAKEARRADGTVVFIDEEAHRLLGLPDTPSGIQNSTALFDSGNTLHDIQEKIDKLRAGEDLVYQTDDDYYED